jgi:5'-3' exonuclease
MAFDDSEKERLVNRVRELEQQLAQSQDALLQQQVYGLEALKLAESFKDQFLEQKAATQHWQANHDCQVEKTRLLFDRRDLPVERVRAYNLVERLQDQAKTVRALVVHLNNMPLIAPTNESWKVLVRTKAWEGLVEAVAIPQAPIGE